MLSTLRGLTNDLHVRSANTNAQTSMSDLSVAFKICRDTGGEHPEHVWSVCFPPWWNGGSSRLKERWKKSSGEPGETKSNVFVRSRTRTTVL